MNPLEWFNFIREILHWDVERQAAFFTGAVVVLIIAGLAFLIYRRLTQKHAREREWQKINELIQDKVELHGRLSRLEGENHLMKMELKVKHEEANKALQEALFQKSQFQALAETLNDLTNRNRQLEADNQFLKGKNAQMLGAGRFLLKERNRLQEEADKLSQAVRELGAKMAEDQTSRQDLADRLVAVQQQIENLASLEGKIWEKPVTRDLVPFRPLAERKVPIIAVANLKGGVGKTTLTANLGAKLWTGGKRILLVDLDYQGSLTSLCLPGLEIADLKQGDRLVHRFFQNDYPEGREINQCLARIGGSSGAIVAATDKLADVEMDALARWLLDPNYPDIRFSLRRLLHSTQVTDEFDIIILDCPPRLTTASINALTCCDYLLIPSLLDTTSVEAVPRFLEWLKILKASPLCSNLSLLGILGNRAQFYEGELVKRQKRIWDELPTKCRDVWGEEVYHFHNIMKQDGLFAEAARDHTFAASHTKMAAYFYDLASEVLRRLFADENHRFASFR